MYVQDFVRQASKAGFTDARVVSMSPVTISDPKLLKVVGNAKFYSITYRLFKLPSLLEPTQEDYGQLATYKVGCMSSFMGFGLVIMYSAPHPSGSLLGL